MSALPPNISLSYAQEVNDVSAELISIAKQLYEIAGLAKENEQLYRQIGAVTSRLLECTDRLSAATRFSVKA
jgi:uncharacterized protein YigA (DUF484 family)